MTAVAPPTCQMSATNKMAAVISCAGMCLVRAAAIAGKASSSFLTRPGHFSNNFQNYLKLKSLKKNKNSGVKITFSPVGKI
jgi:hypothetical protein